MAKASSGNGRLQGERSDALVIFGCIDVHGDEGIGHRDVGDVRLVGMHDLTGVRGGGSIDDESNQFASDDDGVAVLTFEFGDNCPDLILADEVEIFVTQVVNRLGESRRTIDQGDDGRVASAIENFLKSKLKRTELSHDRGHDSR